jgi:hypothetical protein
VRLQLLGADMAAPAVGQDELITKTNYFLGTDPSQWRTNVPNYGKVAYQGVYPGIDLIYYGNQGQLEYDFVVAPGANPGAITLAIQGTDGITLDGQGNLVLHTMGGDVVEQAPVLYQDGGGRQAVSGRFVPERDNRVGFQVGAYDPSRPLVIDPVLSYSTYLGGNGLDNAGGIAVDSSGNAYVTGITNSTNFPITPGANQSILSGSNSAFVTKLNATGTALLYSTYLGGSLTPTGASAQTGGRGIALDSAGNAYVTGWTSASNFPTSTGAFQTAYGGGATDVFVAKLSPSGSLVYSTYLGGSGADGSSSSINGAVAVDSAGNAYVDGPTSSTDFPTTPAAAYPSWNSSWGSAGFITELNATGTGLVYSTYLPGGPGAGIALALAQIYVTGWTTSTSFPTTAGAFQRGLSGSGDTDAFMAVLNPSASPSTQIVYATYLGGHTMPHGLYSGPPTTDGFGIAVDGLGNAYVCGVTGTTDFPTTAGAYQTTLAGGTDAFVAKINPALSESASLVFSTYLGGKQGASAHGITADGAGNAYVTGDTWGGFPTTANAIQASMGKASRNAFVTELNASGSKLLFSTYLGGTQSGVQSAGTGIVVDGSGNIYLIGSVYAGGFPTTSGAFQTTFGGGTWDDFVAKISLGSNPLAVSSTGPSNPLASSPTGLGLSDDSSSLTVANSDRALALLLAIGDTIGTAPFIAEFGSRGQTEILPIPPDVLCTALQSANSMTTLQPVLPHSSSTGAVDRLLADLVSGGLVDALAANALLEPLA